MNDKVLVVKCDALLKPETVEKIRENLKQQIEEGVVVIPSYLQAAVISKPDDVEILFDGPETIPEFLTKTFNVSKEASE